MAAHSINAAPSSSILLTEYFRPSIPTSSSLPLGVVMGANHTLWFTESGKDKIGMLQP